MIKRNDTKAVKIEGKHITSKGAYIGTIKRAEAIKSKNNTVGIEMTFVDDGGRTADYLQLWMENSSGVELPGMNILHAMMLVLGIQDMEFQECVVEKYNKATKEKEKVTVLCYTRLHQRIGLLLRKEEYSKSNGDIGFRMVIVLPFNANTNQTSSEMLGNQHNTNTIERLLDGLKDKLISDDTKTTRPPYVPPVDDAPFDDDLPF